MASGTAVAAQARPGRGRCQRRDHGAARRSIARRPNIRAGEAREGLPGATVFRRDGRGGAEDGGWRIEDGRLRMEEEFMEMGGWGSIYKSRLIHYKVQKYLYFILLDAM